MDSYNYSDNIQVEKANALARYNRFNNISKMFRAVEVFIAVALISWSSTRIPTVFKVSGEYLYACSSYVLNQHVVFLVGNVIVVVCYVLSSHTEQRKDDSNAPEVSEDKSYISNNNNNNNNNSKTTEPDSNIHPAPESLPEEIHGEVFRHENMTVESDAEIVIKQAMKQLERFHRTQSAKLSREISTKNNRELRRSVTERRRFSVAVTDGDGDSKASEIETVERLSNEEFRRTVEAFIYKQQSFLKQQSM